MDTEVGLLTLQGLVRRDFQGQQQQVELVFASRHWHHAHTEINITSPSASNEPAILRGASENKIRAPRFSWAPGLICLFKMDFYSG